VDCSLSDREIFQAMELGDVWGDAELITAYRYLRTHKKGTIPPSWEKLLMSLMLNLTGFGPAPNEPKCIRNCVKVFYFQKM
jgi:hypothetical protein